MYPARSARGDDYPNLLRIAGQSNLQHSVNEKSPRNHRGPGFKSGAQCAARPISSQSLSASLSRKRSVPVFLFMSVGGAPLFTLSCIGKRPHLYLLSVIFPNPRIGVRANLRMDERDGRIPIEPRSESKVTSLPYDMPIRRPAATRIGHDAKHLPPLSLLMHASLPL